MRRRTAVVAAAALGAVALGALAWILTRAPGPEETARAYLSALADGDTGALAAMSGTVDDSALQAFAGAHHYIDDPQIEGVVPGQDGFTTVRATASFDGRRHELSFAVVRSGAGWELGGEFLGSLAIRATFGAPVRVGGVVVDDGDASLFPAVYEVEAAPGVLTGSTLVAVTTRREIVDVEIEVAPDAATVVQPQLEAYAQTCTAGGASIPPQCGLRIPWAADLTTMERVAFRVERMPQVSLSPDATSFAATGGVVIATVTGATRSGEQAAYTYRDDSWTLRGSIMFDGIDTVLQVH